ncbi:MAG: hypothetical protein ACTSRH_01980 [Promethearchaeota archaeon]
MIGASLINSIINMLEGSKESFKPQMDKFFKNIIKILNNIKDFKDELKLYDDFIIHVYIKDLDFNLWIKMIGGSLNYHSNYYEPNPDNLRVVHYILTSDLISKILMREMTASEAYFKGLLEFEGEMSDVLISRNLLNLFFKLLDLSLNE